MPVKLQNDVYLNNIANKMKALCNDLARAFKF